MFPIAWMYYFGTNLENRFNVPEFWPRPEQTYRIPFEKREIQGELERLKAKRLERRARRLEDEQRGLSAAVEGERVQSVGYREGQQGQMQGHGLAPGMWWWWVWW